MIARLRLARSWVLALVFVALPAFASACPVCFDARVQTRVAYFATAGLLTLLPFALVGGLLAYVRVRSRERDLLEAAAAAPAPVTEPPGPLAPS